MDDFPNPDEEFEMMYADDLELLDEMDDGFLHTSSQVPAVKPAPVKSSSVKRGLDFGDTRFQTNTPASPNIVPSCTQYDTSQSHQHSSLLDDSSKEQTADKLFGNIDDIVLEEALEEYRKSKGRKRPHSEAVSESALFLMDDVTPDPETRLIDRIVTMRKKACHESNQGCNSSTTLAKQGQSSRMTKGVPKWPFVSVTNELGDRVYVRLRSEEYFNGECQNVSCQKKITGLLKVPVATLKSQAMELLKHKQEERIAAQEHEVNHARGVPEKIVADGNDLWVVKYKPSCYAELLSDESTNRTLLRWLKLWDKVVFNKEKKPKIVHKDTKNDNHFQKKPLAQVLNEELDEYGRPFHKMVLLCGSPGLGKTTLAHIVATLAGYNVVEVNASDDRSPEAFRTQLEAATQMRSVIGSNPRPNCLVLDEIDGAPAASIETLIKFVLGKDVGKGKKKRENNPGILKRPVICICNDAYVPALRPLRQHAMILHFPPTASERLAARLMTIARSQNLKTDMGALLALCEKTQNDIRSCLSTLNYFKSQGSCLQLSDVRRSNVGMKDVQRGLFSVWQEVFQIAKSKGNHTATQDFRQDNLNSDTQEKKVTDSLLSMRIHNVLSIVQSHGDYERLALGVFENYPCMKLKDSSLSALVKGLDWFCSSDLLSSEIHCSQNYILMPYLAYAFPVWHLLYAGLSWPKINYPSSSHEAFVRQTHLCQLVAAVREGMSPCVQVNYNSHQLVLDALPLLLDIIVPNFRPVSLQLFTSREKEELCNLVRIMIDFNLTYTQERTQEGTYVCVLDPNVEEVVLFSGCKAPRALTYSVKQLVAREIELEKMRKYEQSFLGQERSGNRDSNHISLDNDKMSDSGKSLDSNKKGTTISPPSVPNHLRKLKPKPIIKDVQLKDFFGRIVTVPLTSTSNIGNCENVLKGDIWFHFKEGFNNAVRKTVRMSDLL